MADLPDITAHHRLDGGRLWACSCGEVYAGATNRKEAERAHRAHHRRVDIAWAAA